MKGRLKGVELQVMRDRGQITFRDSRIERVSARVFKFTTIASIDGHPKDVADYFLTCRCDKKGRVDLNDLDLQHSVCATNNRALFYIMGWVGVEQLIAWAYLEYKKLKRGYK